MAAAVSHLKLGNAFRPPFRLDKRFSESPLTGLERGVAIEPVIRVDLNRLFQTSVCFISKGFSAPRNSINAGS
jgi:hypothetical protein